MLGARLCVLCRASPADPQWRPFCSKRCRDKDLAAWVSGHYRVAAHDKDPPGPEDAEEG
jgi:endogenous inhibitor of DNA gyrase (YacG/DUF329 family)